MVDGILVVHTANSAGFPRKWFVCPEESTMITTAPWGEDVPANWAYLVHMVDARRTGADSWEVHDRELDIVIEHNCQTYRMIDLDDLAESIETGSMDTATACRMLRAAQVFVDEYLHGGGKFPSKKLANVINQIGGRTDVG